ncbi:protein singed wings 2 [Fopius arisanus]|uniref:Protein singed wings 2 n=1 Tax=Fopius arisanus TaxID=64838 RepID=A0A0C9RHM2_9HYME|nr:PREDICTED: protein singed wings 2 [Fopius arisanus]
MRIATVILIGIVCCEYSGANGSPRESHPCTVRQSRTSQSVGEDQCFLTDDDHHLWCFGDAYRLWSNNGSIDLRTLTICNWLLPSIDPREIISRFPYIKKLIIANSNLTTLSRAFPSDAKYLEKIHITGTQLQQVPREAFKYLSDLKILDVRNNALTKIDPAALVAPKLQHIHLAGNPWKCEDNTMTWILNMTHGSVARKILDRDKLHCAHPYEGRPLLPVVEIIATLREECNRTVCHCELVYVVGRVGKQTQRNLIAFVSTNCSHQGLRQMPEFIPANTTTLWLDGNQITDLSPLITNPVYRQVLDLYLDNNGITSIDQLEGSVWLDNFRVLSLRGNKLTDLPTYAFENVLLKSGNAVVSLYLGDNPWTCDCLFTPGFQDLLIRYTNLVKDVNKVRCNASKNLETLNKPIRDLTRTEICISESETTWLHPLDVLNIFLASMIITILGKLLYDYWSFKRTGKLPWLVTKIP